MKIIIGSFCLWSSSIFAAAAPVFDYGNWLKNAEIISNQLKEHKTLVDQYNNMLDNTKSLTTYQWDDANKVITNLINTTDTLDLYKKEAGSLNSYLDRYQSEEFYDKKKLTPAEVARLRKNNMASSVAQKRANDAMLRGIDKQQKNIKTDAARLKELQRHAQNATGQKQAIQAASELASAENHQLMQIRSLMIAEHNAQATRAAAIANKEAIYAIGDERFRAGQFKKSKPKSW